jgi:acyl-CoA synthetase (NDP forming)
VRDPTLFEKAMSVLADDPGIAIRLCVLNLPYLEGMTTPTAQMFAAVGRGLSAGTTPGLLTVQTLKPVSDVSRRIMKEHGIPGVTGGLDHAVRAVAQAIWWSEQLRRAAAETTAAPGATATSAGAPATANNSGPAGTVSDGPSTHFPSSERAVLDYLATFNVPVIPSEITHTPEDAAECARRFGGRVVLKIASADISHKTDVGGVRLRLEGDAQIKDAWKQIDTTVRKNVPQARIDGISVSPMRDEGIELFVGIKRDPDWGMVIAVGLGGIWVEALQDTAVRLLPVDRQDVLEMLGSLRAARVLQGFRGAPAADLQALADVVVNIGTAALALGPAAESLEINPLRVSGSRVEALDGLIVWHEPV